MPQGHLNILQPGENLLQLNETLPVYASESAIVRGSVMVKQAGTTFRRCVDGDAGSAGAPGPIVYFSLQDQDQPDVNLATGITGVPCTFPMLLETDQIATDTYTVGQYVSAGSTGVLRAHATGLTAVGVVKKGNTTRWSNDRLADESYGGAERTGAMISIIQVWTVYLPDLA